MSNESIGGKVVLVGAGPGDSGLITRRGASLIQQADVIIYDRLVGSGVLELAADSAELIAVGKAPGKANISQLEIKHVLRDKAEKGNNVGRQTGGQNCG